MKRGLYATALASAAVLVGAVACDDASGPASERVSVALAVPLGGAFNAGEVSLAGSADDDPVIIVRGRQRLQLDRVELNLSRVDLRSLDIDEDDDTDLDTDTDHDTDTESDTDSDQFDRVEFRNPVTVLLPLRGGVIAPFTTVVPIGTYDRVRFWVETAEIEGTFGFDANRDGDFDDAGEIQAFDETVRVRQSFTLRINPPLEVTDGNPANVTITLQPAEWFRNQDRSLFNPRQLRTDNQLRARFRHLIRATLRAIEDGNRNGDHDLDTDTDR